MAIRIPILWRNDDSGLKDAQSGLERLGKFSAGVGATLAAGFAVASAAAIAFGASSLKAAAEAEAIGRGMENAVKNAGVFGTSAKAIDGATAALDKHSTQLAELSGIDDEIINQIKTGWLAVPDIAATGISGINKLAQVSADIAAGTGKDIQSIALMFTKTAGDEETALSKLQKAGIVLSDSQKTVYDQILSTNGEMAAQQYLIETLGAKYAGAASAAANPFEQLKIIFENLQETVGAALLPVVQALVPIFSSFISQLTAAPEFQAFLDQLGIAFQTLITSLMPLMPLVLDLMTSLLPPLMDIFSALAPVIISLVQAFLPLIQAILPPLADLILQLVPIIGTLVNDLFIPLIPVIQSLIEAFMPIISAILPVFGELVAALAPIIVALISAFMPLVEQILPILLSVFEAIMPAVVSVVEAFMPLLDVILPPLISLIEMLMPVIQLVADLLTGPLSVALKLISGLMQLLTGDFEGAGKTFEEVWTGIQDFGKKIVNDIIGVFEGMINFVIDGINRMIGFLNGIKIDVPEPLRGLVGGAKKIGFNVPLLGHVSIPRLADGGIVMPDPGGSLVNVAEAGKPEAIIPLNKLPSMVGGGSTYNINISTLKADATIGEVIVNSIKKYERTSGAVFMGA